MTKKDEIDTELKQLSCADLEWLIHKLEERMINSLSLKEAEFLHTKCIEEKQRR